MGRKLLESFEAGKQALLEERETSDSAEKEVLKQQYLEELKNLEDVYKKAMEDIESRYNLMDLNRSPGLMMRLCFV